MLCNLQKTPADDVATLVIHAKTDDMMKLLFKKLGYQIPTWQLKKRLEVSFIENGSKVQLRGVESNRLPFVLFQKIKVNGQMHFPNTNQKKQPYHVVMPAAEADRPPKLEVELQFMGYY